MRKKWLIILGIVVLILIFVIIGRCSNKKISVNPLTEAGSDDYYEVKYGDIDAKIDITGEVQPESVVAQKSRVSGKVVKLYVDESDVVKIGDILADIEPDYNQANTLFNTKASLERAALALDRAQKNIEDKAELLAKEYISQDDYDKAEEQLFEAQIQHAQAERQYEMISDLDVPGKVVHMYATATGTVIKRNVNEGEMVTSSINTYGEGTVLMEIADLSKMMVKSNINEVDISKFRLGQFAEIKLDAYPYENFSGKITKIAPKATTISNAKVFPVQISINAEGQKAKPGMTAALSIQGESRENVIIIPIGAVFADDFNQDIVYLMPKNEEGKTDAEPIPTPIRLGANDFQMVEVISGLAEGDKIVLSEPGKQKTMQFMM